MSDPKAPDLPEVLTGELPKGWRALAGGFASADVLLVLTDDGLHRVKAREFGRGFAIEKTPLDVIRALLSAYGLHIVSEADRKVLEAMAEVDEETLTNTLESKYTTLENKAVAEAELEARKTRTPLPRNDARHS
jgi:hypothetical protein